MSMRDLEEAFKLIESNQENSDFEGQKPDELVSLAESALGLEFPPTYKKFLSTYGCGDIAGHEFFGVISADFVNSGIPDAVWLTLSERKRSELPKDYVLVYGTGDGDYYALDCSFRTAGGECPVIGWTPTNADISGSVEQVAEDFGKFLLEKIRIALF